VNRRKVPDGYIAGAGPGFGWYRGKVPVEIWPRLLSMGADLCSLVAQGTDLSGSAGELSRQDCGLPPGHRWLDRGRRSPRCIEDPGAGNWHRKKLDRMLEEV